MANGYGNIVGRSGGALRLARPQRMRALPARRRPSVRVRGGRGVPDPGSRAGGGRNPGRPNAEVNAELQETGIRAAQEKEARNRARQAAIETDRMRRQELVELGQQVRGESAAQQEAQQRQLEMQEQRDAAQEMRRFRATAQVGSMLDQRYDELRKEGEIKLQGQELTQLVNMIPGWTPKLDEKGKVSPVYVREESSGEPGSEEIVFGFYEEDPDRNRVQIKTISGEPVRPNRRVMAQTALMNDLDRRERSGIPGRLRQVRAAEAEIVGMEAEAERDLAEAELARRGKPKARDVQKALLDTQKRYLDVEDAIQRAQQLVEGGVLPEGDPNTGEGRHHLLILRDQIEQQLSRLGRSTGQAIPPPDPRDIIPYTPPPMASVQGVRKAPPEAIAFLRQNDTPRMRQQFIDMYGALPEGF